MPANRFDNAPANAATTQAASTPREHAAEYPPVAVGHRARNRKYDADDQAGLEHFTENDDQGGDHESLYFTTSAPRATFSLYSSKNS